MSEHTMSEHTKEPKTDEAKANARASECASAMSGIPDPAAFVREAREVVSVMLSTFGHIPDKKRGGFGDPAVAAARDFLAKHGGGK